MNYTANFLVVAAWVMGLLSMVNILFVGVPLMSSVLGTLSVVSLIAGLILMITSRRRPHEEHMA